MPLKHPPNTQSTSTEQKLSNGPADMPDRGGPKPTTQSTSSSVPLSRAENPVANLENRPGMGERQTTSSAVKLTRDVKSPYLPVSEVKPKTPGKRA